MKSRWLAGVHFYWQSGVVHCAFLAPQMYVTDTHTSCLVVLSLSPRTLFWTAKVLCHWLLTLANSQAHKENHTHLGCWDMNFLVFNPLYPRPPFTASLFSYRITPDCPVAAGQQMLHTGIPAYVNRNRILRKTCSLISAIVYYFRRCLLFEVWWSMRDAVNFQSCEIDTQ